MKNKEQSISRREDGATIIITQDAGLWHLSMSYQNRLPTYDELKKARYQYLPECKNVAQIFPPKNEFVNIHEYCLHLWELELGEFRR